MIPCYTQPPKLHFHCAFVTLGLLALPIQTKAYVYYTYVYYTVHVYRVPAVVI